MIWYCENRVETAKGSIYEFSREVLLYACARARACVCVCVYLMKTMEKVHLKEKYDITDMK